MRDGLPCWEDEPLARIDVVVRLLRHQRAFVEARQDELELARVPVDVADRKNARHESGLLLCRSRSRHAEVSEAKSGVLHSRIMLHQPSGGFEGQATDIMLHAQEILNLKKRLNEIYVKHTGQPLKKIEDALERDYFLTGEMAMEWGIVDKVINKRSEDPAALKIV
jgi:ATP-dependent Clp protease, protease subunit